MTSFVKYAEKVLPIGQGKVTGKGENDVVIVTAVRTALTRARKGALAHVLPEDMLAAVLKETLSRSKINPALIQDVAVGNVLPPGGGATVARMASLYAGIPNTAGLTTVNRQCSSSLQAIAMVANQITAGQIDVGIAAGVESMTHHYGAGILPENMSEIVLSCKEAADCQTPMGITSENVATQFGISRQAQDAFAAESQQRAVRAQRAGNFVSEIVPMTFTYTDEKSQKEVTVTADRDDGIRDGVTAAGLAKLKPAFSSSGTTHAGNASQITDGAAAVLLVRRSVANRLGLQIIGKFVTAAVVGVPPNIMGIGPAYAIPKVLELAGLQIKDIDLFEINEAFASQAVYSVQKLGIDVKKVNPNGGAIALGHPLGATGARQVATAFPECKRQGHKVFCTSMCIGTGMGMAAVFVNEQ